jgi:integrase/recombinase XerC
LENSVALTQAATSAIEAPDSLAVNLPSFLRSLRAERKSERTVEAYREAVTQFAAFLEAQGMPTDVRHIRREHVEAWIIELLGRWKPATANNRYRGCQAFFRWCLEEDIIEASPMARMKPPKVPEQPVPVLRLDDVAKLIATAEKTKTFDDVRDATILRIFYSTGVRLAELANLRWMPDDPEANDVDLDQQVLRVMGKGGRQRLVNMGARSTKALDRYLRLRRQHGEAHVPWLWLSRKGRFTESGIGQMVSRRGEAIGIRVHPHQLRHSWAHAAQVKGMSTNDLKMAGGWRSNAMLERYASSTATERSLAAQKRLNPGDDL